jgi:DNA-binding transcriptional MerR regulator
MIKIGNFSKLTQVSIRSLRHYDKLGLLKPTHIDKFSGHRFYSLDQLPRLNRIMALKDMGLSLKEIVDYIRNDISVDELRAMLDQKRAELCQQIDDSMRRLTHVETRIRMIAREGSIPKLEVVIKSIPTTQIFAYHSILEDGNDIGPRMYEVGTALENYGIKWHTPIGLFHPDPDSSPQDCPKTYRERPYLIREDGFEAAFAFDGDSPRTLPFRRTETLVRRDLPAIPLMATIVFKGPYPAREDASLAFYHWAGENGYRLNGTIRELYLRVVDRDLHHPDNMVEIRFPIRASQPAHYG